MKNYLIPIILLLSVIVLSKPVSAGYSFTQHFHQKALEQGWEVRYGEVDLEKGYCTIREPSLPEKAELKRVSLEYGSNNTEDATNFEKLYNEIVAHKCGENYKPSDSNPKFYVEVETPNEEEYIPENNNSYPVGTQNSLLVKVFGLIRNFINSLF